MKEWADDFDFNFETEMDDQLTIEFSDVDDDAVTIGMLENSENDQKTVSIYSFDNEVEAVTGWLVCIGGEQKGASYRLGFGRNFIGRSLDMDVCIFDEFVSRENHVSIVYDDKGNDFYAVPGTGAAKLQGEPLLSAVRLQEDMILELGDSKYIFVPYCNERRKWE